MLFKDINFSKLFQTGCVRVTFLSENKIHKSNDFFSIIFSNLSSFLTACEIAVHGFFEIFRTLTCKNRMIESISSNAEGLSTPKDIFLVVFWNH